MRDIYYSFPVGAVLVILFSVEVAVKNFLNFLGKSSGDSEKEGV